MTGEGPETLRTASILGDEVRQLLEAEQWTELCERTALVDAAELARHLVGRGWLTAFQAEELLAGRGADLILGEYRLLEPLGGGGMGRVFKAWHRLMRRVVALKVMRPDLLAQPEAVKRFRREIHMAAQLNHPHIVTAHDAAQVGHRHCLVMEYCPGTTLADLVRQFGPVPVGQACDFVHQATLGLQHAHERGLIHRDVKPENLLLSGGIVKILDFGLARFRDPLAPESKLTRLGSVMGTPDFMSPEQAQGLHAADARSDLYSLGCTLYFLIAGRVPFVGGTVAEKLLRQQVEEATPLGDLRGDVPEAVEALASRLMAKDPARRFQTAAEVAAVLKPLAHNEAPAAYPEAATPGETYATTVGSSNLPVATYQARLPAPGPVASAPPPAGKARRRWPVLAGGSAALMGALVLWLLLRRDRPEPELPRPVSWKWQAGPTGPKEPAKVNQVGRLALSPDGRWLAQTSGERNKPQERGEVVLWAVRRDRLVKEKSWNPDCAASAVAFSNDGMFLAWGTSLTLPGTPEITVWDVTKQAEVVRLSHGEGITALAFSPDGLLLSGGRDGFIRIWELPSREPLGFLKGHSAVGVNSLAFSADGRVLASSGSGSGDLSVRLWDVAARKELPTSPGKSLPGPAMTVAVSPDGKTVAGSIAKGANTNPGIKLWDVPSKEPRPGWLYQGDTTFGLVFTPDSRAVVAAQRDEANWGVVRLIWLESGEVETLIPQQRVPVYAIALCRDGSVLATAGAEVRVWFLDDK